MTQIVLNYTTVSLPQLESAWCKTMPDCAKERRLDEGIWLDVESTDVLDITLFKRGCLLPLISLLTRVIERIVRAQLHVPGNFSDSKKLSALPLHKLHYSFTSTAWIWCKTMPDCAKERRLDVSIGLDVESTDVLDITLYWAIGLHHNFAQILIKWCK